jgi:hypothetical protein
MAGKHFKLKVPSQHMFLSHMLMLYTANLSKVPACATQSAGQEAQTCQILGAGPREMCNCRVLLTHQWQPTVLPCLQLSECAMQSSSWDMT